jgi:hypothetical protein
VASVSEEDVTQSGAEFGGGFTESDGSEASDDEMPYWTAEDDEQVTIESEEADFFCKAHDC